MPVQRRSPALPTGRYLKERSTNMFRLIVYIIAVVILIIVSLCVEAFANYTTSMRDRSAANEYCKEATAEESLDPEWFQKTVNTELYQDKIKNCTDFFTSFCPSLHLIRIIYIFCLILSTSASIFLWRNEIANNINVYESESYQEIIQFLFYYFAIIVVSVPVIFIISLIFKLFTSISVFAVSGQKRYLSWLFCLFATHAVASLGLAVYCFINTPLHKLNPLGLISRLIKSGASWLGGSAKKPPAPEL
jgi:hypothetical protein